METLFAAPSPKSEPEKPASQAGPLQDAVLEGPEVSGPLSLADSSGSSGKPVKTGESLPAAPQATRPRRSLGGSGGLLLGLAAVLMAFWPLAALETWLIQCAVDFIGFERSATGSAAYWRSFALWISLGTLLPPALFAGMDGLRSLAVRLREGVRAALLAFFFFCVFFLGAGVCIRHFGSMGTILAPQVFLRFSPLLMCLMLYLSYRLALWLLPQPLAAPPGVHSGILERPRPILVFAALSLGVLASLLFQFLAAPGMGGMSSSPISGTVFSMTLHLPEVFLFIALPWNIFRKGQRIFRPAYVALVVLTTLIALLWLPRLPLAWQGVFLARVLMAAGAALCLYRPAARTWLVG